ncbi:MAG: hypothetical protein J6J78_08680, partial [Clostridia bacterium]|nr:hypothetical protein [Clostridia bacterium]
MKKFIRTLSMLVCVALLMTTVPVETLLDLRANAEDEVVQAVQLPDADPTSAPEQAPVEQDDENVPAQEPAPVPVVEATQAPAQEPTEESDAVPTEAPVVEATEAPVQEPDKDAVEATQEPVVDVQQTGSVDPAVEATVVPEATDAPNAIDYTADAGKSPAFVLGYAEVLNSGVAVYDAAGSSAEVKAEIGKGVVYVFDRSADPDRLQIAFHVGVPELDTGWVDAKELRPMDPAAELHPYFLSCEGVKNLLFYNNSYELPLKVIECVYPETEDVVQDAPVATEAPEAEATEEPEAEVTIEPTEEAKPEATEEPEAEVTIEPTEEAKPEATEEPEAEVTIEPT